MQLEFLLKMFPIATSSRIPAAYRSYPHASHNVIHRYCGMCDRKKEKTPEGAFLNDTTMRYCRRRQAGSCRSERLNAG